MTLRTALAGVPAGLWRLVGAYYGVAVAIAILLLFAHSAFAADLPSQKAPAPAPATTVSWTGFYAGVDGGSVWDNSPATVLAAGEGLTQTGVATWSAYPYAFPGVAVMNASGFAAGGHVGWNYQLQSFSRLVAGLETDAVIFAGNGGHTSTFVTPGGLNPSIAQIGRAMPWAGSTRARIGLLITPALLVYGTGGVAYGAANVNEYAYGTALAATYAPGAQGQIYAGWTAGGGLEWAFLLNWSARVEYLHADLGTHAASFPGFGYGTVPSFPVPQQFLAEVPMRANVVKLGVSYHFNGLLTGDPAKDFPAPPSL
ncbi:MAG TPA: outer membrane beta-barrel protein [Methylocystis sp.]|nr:outer membrane beta-barrel protein [Methylocystis sp.]